MGEPSGHPREVASLLSFAMLRYLGRVVGKREAERVRVAAGETRPIAALTDRAAWSTRATTLAIGDAARELTGDPQIGRRGGEELFRFLSDVGLHDLHKARGDVASSLEAVVDASSKVSVGRSSVVIERGDRHLLVESHYVGSSAPHAMFCDYALGYWSSIPSVFGSAGYAIEVECESRGDDRCLTRLTWSKPAAAPDVDAARRRADAVFFNFEELQRMAADIIEAEDVSAVLDLVVHRAGHAVMAPKFLLAVRLDDAQPLRVHHVGFRSAGAAEAAALRIQAGGQTPSTLVIDVASKRRYYGCLAAVYPNGTQATDTDRRLMSAYAAHAAAALEATAAFEQAQRDRDTAQALLDLSTRLAGASTVAEVSQRLVNALPALAGGCRGSVYLWDASAARLRFEAADPLTPRAVIPDEIVVADYEGAAELLASGEAVWLDVDATEGRMRELLVSSGVTHNVSIPVVVRGEFLGLVSASFEHPIAAEGRAVLTLRLRAFADQAATALDNARLLERTRHQATHDGLTGLPNRPMLEDRANRALAAAKRSRRPVALLFVDLDRFKNVNDTLGHHAGDDLIRQVAQRLEDELREVDTVARLGGDEFVVLLPEVASESSAILVADRLVRSLDAPFSVAGNEVFVSCSIGIALSSGAGEDYESLLQHADAAMYRAKAAGANGYEVHEARPVESRQRRLELETALHGALANDELSVVYQPQVELTTGRIIGAEALVRWNHPVFGFVGPDVFIPIAEEAGLIAEIDRWVRLTSMRQVRRWQDAGGPPLRISFNVSTRELRNPALPYHLAGDIAAAGLEPSMVELEITERVVMVDDDHLVAVLDALARVGVRLAIDDFGTGSSVLRRLQRHPVDTLKIDRSFIADLVSSSVSSGAVVAALLQMGSSLGIEVLAEGVETEEQRAALVELGCPLAQGYLFSKPLSAEAMAELLASHVPELTPA